MAITSKVSNSPLSNSHFINVWRVASIKEVQKNPSDQAGLYLQFALNELHNLTTQRDDINTDALAKRLDIFGYFRAAAQLGYPRALFFEGLALLEGFGTNKDIETGTAFIRVAAMGRGCDLALNFLQLRLGQAFLYGKERPQSYTAAAHCLQKAGDIAIPELLKIANKLKSAQAKVPQLIELPQISAEVISYRTKLRMS